MKEYIKLHLQSINTFRKHWYKFAGYQLITTVIMMAILTPGINLLFELLMHTKGFSYITNSLVKDFLISPQGLLMVVLAIIFGFVVILLQIGGLIVISNQVLTIEGELTYRDVVLYSMKRLKYLLSFDGIIVALYFVILAPWLGGTMRTSIFSDLEIPGFIMQVIEANTLYNWGLVFIVVLIAFFAFRWQFSMYVLLLDKKANRRFLKTSANIVKQNVKEIIKFYVSELIVAFLGLLILVALLLFLAFGISFIPGLSDEIKVLIILSLGLFVILIAMFISLPLTTIETTLLYQKLTTRKEGLDIRNRDKKSLLSKMITNRLLVILSTLTILIGSFLFLWVTIEEEASYNSRSVGITAHRGSSYEAPENTLIAIEKAISNGATHVEIDVQLTKDGELILLHDETFKRTTGIEKRPDEMTLEETKQLDAGIWFGEEFEGEKIPTLQEVIDFCKGKITLNIEIKGSNHSPEICDALVSIIQKNHFSNDCVITSLNYEDLVRIEELNPLIDTGYIMFVALGDLSDLNIDFYSIEASNVNEEFVNVAHELGREVHVWTINEESDMLEMLAYGVDNIITDYDKVLYNLIHE